uniref:Putative secreted protein n=1 Tax=Ixodes ricinus TaxID=34613 RepID=A0A6B0UIY4_IXORI
MWMSLWRTLTVCTPVSLGTKCTAYWQSSKSAISASSELPDGDVTRAAMSNPLVPGILKVNWHLEPTSAVGAASRCFLIFSRWMLEPLPVTLTVNGEPLTWWSANLRLTM